MPIQRVGKLFEQFMKLIFGQKRKLVFLYFDSSVPTFAHQDVVSQ